MLHVTGKFTIAVAQKLLQNAAKGNPYFKPHKGAHGGVSWFKVSGEAHAGLDKAAVVEVRAMINEAYVYPEVDEKIVVEEIENTKRLFPEFLIKGHLLNKERGMAFTINKDIGREFDVRTWDAIGERCSKLDRAIKIKVPRGKLSKQEGIFLLVPPLVAKRLVIDYGQLQSAIIKVWDHGEFMDPRTVEAKKNTVTNTKEDLARVVTLWIGPYETEEEAVNAVIKFESEVGRPYGVATVVSSFGFRTVTFRTGLYSDELAPGVFQVISLTYPNYRHARSAYKQLLPLAAERRKVHCFAGANWPQKKKDPVLLPSGQTLGSDAEYEVLEQRYWYS